eukprot:15457274-Alexandrium_andersonii.AAC.1
MAFWNRKVIAKALLFVAWGKCLGDLVGEAAALEHNRKGVAAEQVAAVAGLATPAKEKNRGRDRGRDQRK